MTSFRTSLAARIFLAIAATAILVITVMALLVALSMRDGFARYLLRGELTRFDDLVQELVLQHQDGVAGWPMFSDDPRVWADFVRDNFPPLGAGPPPTGTRPSGPPPPGGPGGDALMIGDRMALLGPSGDRIAGATNRSNLFEQRAICADDACVGNSLLGYIGLNAPVFSDSAGDSFFLRRQYMSLALSALIAILISAVAAFVVARHILTPIRQLELGAKQMASGDYTTRIVQDRKDELGQLIGHYNGLAATLEKTAKAEREWLSNTSHELQTPLATLRAQIEAVQDGIRLPNALTLTAMHAAVLRLSRLVQDIKILSYSREGELTTAFQRVDLSDIVGEAAAFAEAQLAAKSLTVRLDVPDALHVACDPVRIAQVVDNLLQNAIRYTDAPGQIRIRVQDAGPTVHLIVDDSPPAPLNDDIPRIFERFFRAETSRSRVFGGSGLGLSVCRAIIEAHGGTITAALSDMGGLCMTVSLPKGKP